MREYLYLFILSIILLGCKETKGDKVVYKSETLWIHQTSKHVYRHVSFLDTESFGKVPCNGMIVYSEDEAVIFDTPTDDKTSSELIDWVSTSLKCKITAIIPTHYHVDNLGGLHEFHRQKIPSYAYDKTIRIAKEYGYPQPQHGFQNHLELKVSKEKVYVEFLGEGHTCDNVIGYFPSEDIMFGGCLIKETGSEKGNLAEANIGEWSETVRKVKQKYPDTKIVIPGHGKTGGTEFLDYTIHLFEPAGYAKQIDSLLNIRTSKPFNGIIFISQNGVATYSKICGYSDLENKTPLKINDQFVIGSISKQFTAVIVLREYDKGHLKLDEPIRKYLPEIGQSWADSITVHHLLAHTHGITELNKPTLFKAGTQYAYSQIGYDLLAKIAEKTSGKTFAALSIELFDECGMKYTFHPDLKAHKSLVKGYTENENGRIEYDTESFMTYVAAGSFISTAGDLNIWNRNFYEGGLLKEKTLEMLKTKQPNAVRNHPIFGTTAYGYGITVDTEDNILLFGQTGYAPGFVSMNFYFPEKQTSVIVLENIAYDTDIKKTFFYHTEILKYLRQEKRND